MNWCRFILGLSVSVIGGDLVIYPIVAWYLWPQLIKHHGVVRSAHTFTRQVGWIERALYTGALFVGAWQWVGIWLAVKVATRWRSTAGDDSAPVDGLWLIGTALSVLFGFIGALIALGHLPSFGKP
jgi:hypothetical protein